MATLTFFWSPYVYLGRNFTNYPDVSALDYAHVFTFRFPEPSSTLPCGWINLHSQHKKQQNNIKLWTKFHKRYFKIITWSQPTQTSWKGHDVLRPHKTLSRRLKKDVGFTTSWRRSILDVLKTSDLRRLEGVQFTTSWRRLIYDVFRTSCLRRSLRKSDLHRLEDVQFAASWKHLIYDVFRMSDLRRLEDVWFMSSWRHPVYDVLKRSDLGRLEDVCKTKFV